MVSLHRSPSLLKPRNCGIKRGNLLLSFRWAVPGVSLIERGGVNSAWDVDLSSILYSCIIPVGIIMPLKSSQFLHLFSSKEHRKVEGDGVLRARTDMLHARKGRF